MTSEPSRKPKFSSQKLHNQDFRDRVILNDCPPAPTFGDLDFPLEKTHLDPPLQTNAYDLAHDRRIVTRAMKVPTSELLATHRGKEGSGAAPSLPLDRKGQAGRASAFTAAEERESSGAADQEQQVADESSPSKGLLARDPRAHDPFHLVGHVIGPTSLLELVSCPCCQQCFDDAEASHSTLNEPLCIGRHFSPQTARDRSLLTANEPVDDAEDEIEDDDDLLPGVLAAGVHYTPKRVLVEGWLHKKGTGKDWLGSRAWKPRWARLALARVDGYDSEVPIMLIYWYQSSAHASTVILLDSTVVLAVDLDDKDRWNAHRFEIRHVQKQDNVELATRTFSAPQKGRDAWVYAISQALLSYEKQKDKHRKIAQMHRAEALARRSRSPDRSAVSSPTYDEVWTGDRFVTVERRRPSSPPSSPVSSSLRSSMKHPTSPNLPRPKSRAVSGTPAAARKVAPLEQTGLLCQTGR